MTGKTRVNFHCHSDLSDGALPPEALAGLLARDGVRYAALTDHNTTAGLERFREALRAEGVGAVPGLETSALHGDRAVHLLAYGFDRTDPALETMLRATRRHEGFGLPDVLRPFRRGRPEVNGGRGAADEGPGGLPTVSHAIDVLHGAGGHVFLAHPLELAEHEDALGALLDDLRREGLDGVEAYYAPYPPERREQLAQLARERGMKVAAGTDFHSGEHPRYGQAGVDVDTTVWKEFRDTLNTPTAPPPDPKHAKAKEHDARFSWRRFLLRIVVPAVLTFLLFVVAFFGVFLPSAEEALLARKRELTHELTSTAVSILEEYQAEVEAGRLSLEEAQETALERIAGLHYGPERKDYFWVTDLQPVMLMHPYRRDLEGENLSDFEDESGKRVFVEFVDTVRRKGEGFVEYVWQWNDDPNRIAPKLSYVRIFEPWGWIVGTGIYLNDVEREIGHLTDRLVLAMAVIGAAVAVLLFVTAQHSLAIERERRRAERALQESHEKYRTLVESSSEGTLMLLEGRCAYANAWLLRVLGYEEEELPLLDLFDLLPEAAADADPTVRYFQDLLAGKPCPPELSGQLRLRSGAHADVAFAVRPVALGRRTGHIITVREAGDEELRGGVAPGSGPEAWLVQDLQASLSFLNEPVAPLAQEPPSCSLETPVKDVADGMARQGCSAVLVRSAKGDAVGIVTGGDLAGRVLARDGAHDTPAFEVMSSPLVSIDGAAPVYEALLRMREKAVRHLAVRDRDGRVLGLVRSEELLQFHGYASAVVTRQVESAQSVDEVAAAREQLPAIVSTLLNTGTRPQSVMRLMSAVHDAATEKLLRLALEDAGPPPVRFAFLCMGSQGRREETLVTDQDNGIIYEDPPAGAEEQAAAYFAALGKRVCADLNAVGYDYCVGGMMAENPRWCGPRSAWEKMFREWVSASEPEDLMRVDMAFDFRSVYGAADLASGLRRHAFHCIAENPPFLLHMARNTLHYKPPLGWFGQIRGRSGGEGARTVDSKDAMMCVVKYARAFALRERFPEVGTLDRLWRLREKGLLTESGHEEAMVAFEYLMRLRLRNQAGALAAGEPPGNALDARRLTHIESQTLRETFTQLAALQKHLSYAFLGVDET